MKSGSSTATTMRTRTPRATPVYRDLPHSSRSTNTGLSRIPSTSSSVSGVPRRKFFACRDSCTSAQAEDHAVSPLCGLQLRHVGPMRAERQAADLGPAGAAVFEGLSDVAGVLPGGPDEDGGAGAGDGGAKGTEGFGRVDQVH